MTKEKILIIGSYGSSNIGDEALLSVVLQKYSKNAEVFVLSGNSDDTLLRHKKYLDADHIAPHFPFGIRSLFSFSWIKSFKFLAQSNRVIFGGGGLFTDDYRLKAVLLWAWHVLFIRALKKPYSFLGNSFGPFKTELAKNLTTWALEAAQNVQVRDKISEKYVKELSPGSAVTCIPDLAFSYKYLPKEDLENKERKKVLAFNIRDWRGLDIKEIEKFLDKVLFQNYGVLLIAMEAHDAKLMDSLVKRHVSVVRPKDFEELLDVLSGVEVALGMRLHFLIAASIARCKISGISYSSKVEGVLQDIHVPYISAENMKAEDLYELFKRAEKSKVER